MGLAGGVENMSMCGSTVGRDILTDGLVKKCEVLEDTQVRVSFSMKSRGLPVGRLFIPQRIETVKETVKPYLSISFFSFLHLFHGSMYMKLNKIDK